MNKNTISAIAFLFATTTFLICLISRSGFSLSMYPWYFPDSYDWIANGISYSNPEQNFSISHRTMLLPLIYSLLNQLHLQNLFALLGSFAYAGTIIVAWHYTRRLIDTITASCLVVLLASAYPFITQSAFIGADVLAVMFQALTSLSFLLYLINGSSRILIVTALATGLGIHAQYIGAIWIPIMSLFLFIEERDSKLRVTHRRISELAQSKFFYVAILIGSLSVFGPLLPRLLKYQVIYSSGVSHLELIDPSFKHFIPFIIGLIGQLSWPISLLAFLGLYIGFFRAGLKLLTSYLLVWLLSMLVFFGIFYSWFDIRFAIYCSIPFLIFAAIGSKFLLESIYQLLVTKKGQNTATIALLSSLAFTPLLRPDTNPFSGEVLLTTQSSTLQTSLNSFDIQQIASRNVFSLLLEEGAQRKSELNSGGPDTLLASKPLEILFERIRTNPEIDLKTTPIFFFQTLGPDQYYYVHNRNIIYLHSKVETISDLQQLSQISDKRILITLKSEIPKIQSVISNQKVFLEEGQYIGFYW